MQPGDWLVSPTETDYLSLTSISISLLQTLVKVLMSTSLILESTLSMLTSNAEHHRVQRSPRAGMRTITAMGALYQHRCRKEIWRHEES